MSDDSGTIGLFLGRPFALAQSSLLGLLRFLRTTAAAAATASAFGSIVALRLDAVVASAQARRRGGALALFAAAVLVLLVVGMVLLLVVLVVVGVVPFHDATLTVLVVVTFEPLRGRWGRSGGGGGDDGGGRNRHQGFRRLQLVQPRRPSIVDGGVIALLDGTIVAVAAPVGRRRGGGRALLAFFPRLISRFFLPRTFCSAVAHICSFNCCFGMTSVR